MAKVTGRFFYLHKISVLSLEEYAKVLLTD